MDNKTMREALRKVISPSKRRIFDMEPELILGHGALIDHKKSKLSSTQRRRVLAKRTWLLEKGKITQTDIDNEFLIAKEILDNESRFTLTDTTTNEEI